MRFDRNPKKSPKSSRKNRRPTMSNPPTRRVHANPAIPKNNLRGPEEDSEPRANTPIANNQIVDVFSPIPKNFEYTPNLPSHYQLPQLDWGEPSFGFNSDSLDDNTIQNVPAHQNNAPFQEVNPTNDNQSILDNPAIDNEIPEQTQTATAQLNIQVNDPSPIYTQQDNQYLYNSLEDAFVFWLSKLKIGDNSKTVYKGRVIYFIRLLDAAGIYNLNKDQIQSYCDQIFRPTDRDHIRSFKSVVGKFFKWVNDNTIYNKIKSPTSIPASIPKDIPTPIPKETSKSVDEIVSAAKTQMLLENLMKRLKSSTIEDVFPKIEGLWAKTLKNDKYTNMYYKIYVENFAIFLERIQSMSPTLDDIRNYMQAYPEVQSPHVINEFKSAIKSFLKFIERLGIPQHPEVYKFLNSKKL